MKIRKEFRLYLVVFVCKILAMKHGLQRLGDKVARMRAAQKRYALSILCILVFIPVVSFSCYFMTSRGEAAIEKMYARLMSYSYGPDFLCKIPNETDPIIYSKIKVEFDWWVTSEQRQSVIDSIGGVLDQELSSATAVIRVPAKDCLDIFRISKRLEDGYKEVTKTTVIRSMEKTHLNF